MGICASNEEKRTRVNGMKVKSLKDSHNGKFGEKDLIAHLQKIFEKYDIDSDGALTPDEVEEMLKELGSRKGEGHNQRVWQ